MPTLNVYNTLFQVLLEQITLCDWNNFSGVNSLVRHHNLVSFDGHLDRLLASLVTHVVLTRILVKRLVIASRWNHLDNALIFEL